MRRPRPETGHIARRALRRSAAAFVITGLIVGSARAQPSSALDPAFSRLHEAQRRGLLGDRLSPGALASDLRLRDSAWTRWFETTRVPSTLSARLRPRVTFIGLWTDPELQLRPEHLDVRDGDAVDPVDRWRIGAAGRARFHENVTAGVDFAFDTRGDNDPRNRTRTFGQLDASNNFDAAWIRFGFDHGAVTVGRLPYGWGPSRGGGLLLSDVGPAFDQIHGRLDWGDHVLQTFVAQLSSEIVDDVSSRRWLHGHRADLFFFDDDLRIALSELVIVAGPGEGLNLRYLNPIPLWAQIQVENDGDDSTQVNAIQSIDATWNRRVGPWHLRTYAELVVDDLQIDDEGRERNPDQIAWTAGLDAARGPWLWGYEYRRIGSWTYLHRGNGTDHRNYARPLGAPEGPDTDRHDLRVEWRDRASWRVFGGIERWRRGENRLSTGETREGQVDQPFPRGTVESRWVGRVGLEWERPGTARATLQAAFHTISNVNNVPGVDEDVLELRLVLDVFLPALAYAVDD